LVGDYLKLLTPEELEEEKNKIEKGKESHKGIVAFQDWMFTSLHPCPPDDANAELRTNKDMFDQSKNPNVCHPCSIDPRELMFNENERTPNYCELCNVVERHVCNDYCDKNSTKRAKKRAELLAENTDRARELLKDPLLGIPIKCRFSFPKPMCDVGTHVKIIQDAVCVNKDRNEFIIEYRIEMITDRNDKWLVCHPRHLLESWRGNIDFQLIVDVEKVLRYMTKYVTKVETNMTKGIAAMIRKMLKKTVESGLSVQAALK